MKAATSARENRGRCRSRPAAQEPLSVHTQRLLFPRVSPPLSETSALPQHPPPHRSREPQAPSGGKGGGRAPARRGPGPRCRPLAGASWALRGGKEPQTTKSRGLPAATSQGQGPPTPTPHNQKRLRCHRGRLLGTQRRLGRGLLSHRGRSPG